MAYGAVGSGETEICINYGFIILINSDLTIQGHYYYVRNPRAALSVLSSAFLLYRAVV